MTLLFRLAVILFIPLLAGCQSFANKEIRLQNLAKSELDMIVDQHIRSVNALSRELTVKLYKRNPRELAKTQNVTVEQRLEQLLSSPRPIRHPELNNLYGLDALPFVFDEGYRGDRVFALMVCITGMLHASYNYQDEFFMFDQIDQQKLYNSARNIEKIVWQLRTKQMSDGQPFLLTDSVDEGVINLSYERLFGKLIATQDMAAAIVSESTDRTINRLVQGVATAPFLPI